MAAAAAAAPANTTVWVVTTTHFTDDYKPRGRDWSSAEPPSMFTSYEAAFNYKQHEMLEYLYERVDEDAADDKEPEGEAEWWRKNAEGDWRLRDWRTVGKVITHYTEGEYVRRRIAWDIGSCEVLAEWAEPEDEEEEPEETASASKRTAADMAPEDAQADKKSKCT